MQSENKSICLFSFEVKILAAGSLGPSCRQLYMVVPFPIAQLQKLPKLLFVFVWAKLSVHEGLAKMKSTWQSEWLKELEYLVVM